MIVYNKQYFKIHSFGCNMQFVKDNKKFILVTIRFNYDKDTLKLDHVGLREFISNMMEISNQLSTANADNVNDVILSLRDTTYIKLGDYFINVRYR